MTDLTDWAFKEKPDDSERGEPRRDPYRRANDGGMGQLFHFFDSPNRFGLPPFYTLHVWAWKDNHNGTFVNWNPDVPCDGFNPQRP